MSGMLASLVGSAAVGACFILSPVASMLTDRYGIRKTSFVGSFLASVGMLLSAICLRYAGGYEVTMILHIFTKKIDTNVVEFIAI